VIQASGEQIQDGELPPSLKMAKRPYLGSGLSDLRQN